MPVTLAPYLRKLVDRALDGDGKIDKREARKLAEAVRAPSDRAALDRFVLESPALFTEGARALLTDASATGTTGPDTPVGPLGPVGPGGRASALSSIEVRRIERVQLDANGMTPALSFELPDDVLSVSVLVEGDVNQNYLVNRLEKPDGKAITEENPPGSAVDHASNPYDAGQLHSPNHAMMGALMGRAELLAPNNPDVKIGPGLWKVMARGWKPSAPDEFPKPATGTVDVVLTIKRCPAPPRRGRIDLHLYFTGADGFGSAEARRSPIIEHALAKVKQLYRSVGVEIGQVTYEDVDRGLQRPDDRRALDKLLASGDHKTGVGIYFVHSLPGGMTVGGMSCGLPGPCARADLPESGVLIATNATPASFGVPASAGDRIGSVAAHELGHYLGLFHTEDDALACADPLDDTDHVATNVMYPLDPRDETFSRGQGWVMLRHPAVVITEVTR